MSVCEGSTECCPRQRGHCDVLRRRSSLALAAAARRPSHGVDHRALACVHKRTLYIQCSQVPSILLVKSCSHAATTSLDNGIKT